jgi:hypothetical protein
MASLSLHDDRERYTLQIDMANGFSVVLDYPKDGVNLLRTTLSMGSGSLLPSYDVRSLGAF